MPRGPSVLTLYTAADLLTGPGCPVCRYAGEAADRYLAWFALEGHADVVTITRLCSSLGMCPRHTRGLMSQPGAASRLTAVYQYVMRAARDRLSGGAARLGACPGCGHDDAATDRAVDTRLEGLAVGSVRDRCRELGGLCVPHLRRASARGTRQTLAWLSQTMTEAAGSGPACPDWLAGTDHGADVRAALRQAAPASAPPGSRACVACLAGVRAEDDGLARVLRVPRVRTPSSSSPTTASTSAMSAGKGSAGRTSAGSPCGNSRRGRSVPSAAPAPRRPRSPVRAARRPGRPELTARASGLPPVQMG